jgi:hypothetical protein
MKRTILALALLFLPAFAAAQIPLADVTVLGSPPRVLNFPARATLDHIGLTPGALNLVVIHATPWPAVSIDGGDPVQSATLWVFLKINGKWYATGAERLRPQQIEGTDKPEDADVNHFIGVSWLYDAGRWGPMAGYVPKTGEQVGMMVAAGSSRSDDQAPVQERTRIVQFAWPGSGGAAAITPTWIEGQVAPPTPPEPPEPPSPPVPPPATVDLSPILLRLSHFEAALASFEARVGALEIRKIPVSCSAAANLGFTRIPVSCRLD